jgi:alkylation response protein AidB-like acyl-CoA dehydrogenase
MEFGLSQEQIALQDSVNRFLDEKIPLERVRKYAKNDEDDGLDIWSGLTDLGIPALLIPEEYGGVGLGALEAAIVAESLGRRTTPGPFLSTAILATKALILAGSEKQKELYLPKIADGSLIVAAAISETTGSRRNAGISCKNNELTGRSLFAMDIENAQHILVVDRDNRLYFVERDAKGVDIVLLPQVDRTRSLAEITYTKASGELLSGSENSNIVSQVVDLGRVIIAADSLGASQEMLDQAVAYAMQREQFNRVIASFQAVKHLCAEMAAEVEPSRSLVWYAAHALEDLPEEAHLMACHTKAHLAEVGQFVGKTSTMVHGGMGFTDLLGLHYWFKRLGYNRQILGSPESIREEAATAQGL